MKVISLLLIIWSFIAAIYGILVVIEAGNFGWTIQDIFISIGVIFQACFGFYLVGAGIKGSNTPSKALTFNVSALVLAVFELIFLIVHDILAHGEAASALFIGPWGVGISIAAMVLGFCGYFFGNKVYKASLK